MSAVVIDFATAVAQRARRVSRISAAQPTPSATTSLTHDFTFWNGASGTRYVHTVYPLFECPEVPNTMLRTRAPAALRAGPVLHVGRVEQDAPSLNLAEIRRRRRCSGRTRFTSTCWRARRRSGGLSKTICADPAWRVVALPVSNPISTEISVQTDGRPMGRSR